MAAGLGIVTFAFLPLALPGLLLVIAPLALVAMVGVLLAMPIWLGRIVLRSGSRRIRLLLRPEMRSAPSPPTECREPVIGAR